MKVICITDQDFNGDGFPEDERCPTVGDILTVVDECKGEGMKGIVAKCYEFAEIEEWVFDIRNFAILPGIDDCELVEDEELVELNN